MRPNGPFLCTFLLAPLSITFLFFGFLVHPAGAGTLADDCSGPVISSTFEATEWTVPDAASCYSIYFDEPTAWFVRAAAGPATGGVYLELPACSRDAGLRVLDRRLDSLLLDVREAGWRSVCFGQIDGAGAPVEVKLVSRAFDSPAQKDGDPMEEEPDPDPLRGDDCSREWALKDGDPMEEEPDPDPLRGDDCSREWAYKVGDPMEEEPDPDPLRGDGCSRDWVLKDGDPMEEEPDPDPMVGGGGCESRATRLDGICRAAGTWGARHVPACATSIAAAQWVDPGDGGLYRLVIDDWTRVAFEIDGRAALAIRDTNGQRVGGRALLGSIGETALSVNLAPGSYWLEAAGDPIRFTASAF